MNIVHDCETARQWLHSLEEERDQAQACQADE